MSNFQKMKIVNLTPDSFSDGGKYLGGGIQQLRPELLKEFQYLDLGGQSTAPSSVPIDEDAEKKRFLPFIDFYFKNNVQLSSLKLTIDTYRPNTLKWISQNLRTSTLLFNDVSGVLDQELLNTLNSLGPGVSYIFCSTFVENRLNACHHLKFTRAHLNGHQVALEIQHSWERVLEFWYKHGLKNELILDPGLGLSKSREQNQFLWQYPKSWLPPQNGFKIMWAVSRKTFLRPMGNRLRDTPEIIPGLDRDHQIHSQNLFNNFLDYNFIWRYH